MKYIKVKVKVFKHKIYLALFNGTETKEELEVIAKFLYKKTDIQINIEDTLERVIAGDNPKYAGSSTYNNGPNSLILYRKGSRNSTLVHESFHVTCAIMKECGVVLNNSTEECFAYLLGFVTQSLKKKIKYADTDEPSDTK